MPNMTYIKSIHWYGFGHFVCSAVPSEGFPPCPPQRRNAILSLLLYPNGQSVLYSLGRIQHRMAKAQINLIFRAFSDRTRLRILCLLTHDEMCVGDLVKVLQVPQPTASRHLSYLRRAGLVETRKNGLWVHYRLARARMPFIATF